MASTYTPIATYTAPSAQTTVSFSSFSGYTDLRLIINATSQSGSNMDGILRFNSDSGSNYSLTYWRGNGSGVTTNSFTGQSYIYLTQVSAYSSTPVTTIVEILNYSNTTTYKTVLSRESDTINAIAQNAALWRGSTGSANQAITSMTISTNGTGSFATGSTFTLYGITAA